jgi:hypothetical protein
LLPDWSSEAAQIFVLKSHMGEDSIRTKAPVCQGKKITGSLEFPSMRPYVKLLFGTWKRVVCLGGLSGWRPRLK